MNLILAPFIDVVRRDGSQERIRPAQIVSDIEGNPVIDVLSPRPDFRSALYQFLIGLLQTTCDSVQGDEDWDELWDSPPNEQELDRWFEPIIDAFELGGNGPRFMQDPSVRDETVLPCNSLLIDYPGANTCRRNTDHFVKRSENGSMSKAMAAAALFCLQTNAPAGGTGYRTGLRGGGPLTTLVLAPPQEGKPASLWQHLWLNVLPRGEYLRLCGNPDRHASSDRFPWMKDVRVSGKDGVDTYADDVHPDQLYWALPRRLWLHASGDDAAVCSVTGENSDEPVAGYSAKNLGVNYAGEWLHPLSPHFMNKDGLRLPRHPLPGGIVYRHWPALALPQQNADQPAAVVVKHLFRNIPGQFRLWAFGFDMDNMKARAWYDTTMPLYSLSGRLLDSFAVSVDALVEAAVLAGQYLRTELRNAWADEQARIGLDKLAFVQEALWENTEDDFYSLVDELHGSLGLKEDELDVVQRTNRRWLSMLRDHVMRLFDQWAEFAGIENGGPKRAALAHRNLVAKLKGKKLREVLNLSTAEESRVRP